MLQTLGVPWPGTGHVPLGIHGDGVPFRGVFRKQSLDFITINLPSSSLLPNLRIPFTVLNTKFHAGYQTKEAILKILLWSLDALKEGKYPSKRHDGTAWLASDRSRATLAGSGLQKALLCEIRGDWDWLNNWFNIPAWNTGSGMCWLCNARYVTFKEQTAGERAAGLSKANFCARVEAMGKTLCPLWAWPEMAPQTLILPDWLHAVDQGIASDICGQLLFELANKQEGASLGKRVANVWQEVQALYKEYGVAYRLATLTPEVLSQGKKVQGSQASRALQLT